MAKPMPFYALVDECGRLVMWESKTDGERGLEIYATRKEAKAAKMAGERIQKVKIVAWDWKGRQ